MRAKTHSNTVVSDEDCRTQSCFPVQFSYNFWLYVPACMADTCFRGADEGVLLFCVRTAYFSQAGWLKVRLAFQTGATAIPTKKVSEQRRRETGLTVNFFFGGDCKQRTK